MTSITWSFMLACKRSRPRSPGQEPDYALASPYLVPFYPMLLLSPEGIASSRLIIRVCSLRPVDLDPYLNLRSNLFYSKESHFLGIR
jgi:hypothetical protein